MLATFQCQSQVGCNGIGVGGATAAGWRNMSEGLAAVPSNDGFPLRYLMEYGSLFPIK
jgi:hypothetical protein